MRTLRVFLPAAAALLLAGAGAAVGERGGLGAASEFEGIADDTDRAVALFEEAGKVITHPRCMNCHPAGDRPTQTDSLKPHEPMVVRGPDGFGASGLRCGTCHHDANYDPAQVPGHPKWHLAPLSMGWQDLSLGEICRQIKDRERNGGMDMAELVHHMAEDSLVGWAWEPGAGRTAAPGTQKEFGALIRAWADAGAHCPSS